MSTQLDPGVKRRIKSPSDGERVTLIIGVENDSTDDVVDTVSSAGATVEDQLPCDYLAVSIKEPDLEDLCDLEVVSSIEIEGEATVLSQDFGYHLDMIL
jgi:hypothetical protein